MFPLLAKWVLHWAENSRIAWYPYHYLRLQNQPKSILVPMELFHVLG